MRTICQRQLAFPPAPGQISTTVPLAFTFGGRKTVIDGLWMFRLMAPGFESGDAVQPEKNYLGGFL